MVPSSFSAHYRFVDRDMIMQYMGNGIGHSSNFRDILRPFREDMDKAFGSYGGSSTQSTEEPDCKGDEQLEDGSDEDCKKGQW